MFRIVADAVRIQRIEEKTTENRKVRGSTCNVKNLFARICRTHFFLEFIHFYLGRGVVFIPGTEILSSFPLFFFN